ncbi:phosphopantetheine-binding protein [Nocardia sp. NPDC051463]|uniref:phosphopantetheine-binding protein n=1 Tax=Nocardia sp. NPDC051463 TaxID=3154845 RepID=UPI00344EC103
MGAPAALTATLRRYLADRLPEFMVPAAVMLLDRFPLTPNGKLDRRALPQPEFVSGITYLAPRTERERILIRLFADVLRVDAERVGVEDDFFALGGHSLLATRLINKIGTELGIEIPIRVLFDAPTAWSIGVASY